MNKSTIQLPILVDERNRSQLQSVQLWVKEGPSAPWKLSDKAPPTQPSFTFRAPQDGEYWFNIVSVDRSGRSTPADVAREAPALMVMIDTQPPQVDVQPLQIAPEGQYVRFQGRDPHLDAFKTRFYFQTGDFVWRALDPVSGKADTFCVPAQAAWTGNVRVVAVDLAGNVASREMQLSGGVTTAGNAPNTNMATEAITPLGNQPLPSAGPGTKAQNSFQVNSSPVVTPPPASQVFIPPIVANPSMTPTLPPQSTNIQVAASPTEIRQVNVAPTPANVPQIQSGALPARQRLPDVSEIVVPVSPGPANGPVIIETGPPLAPVPSQRPVQESMAATEVTVQKITPPQLFDPAIARKTPSLGAGSDVKPASLTTRDQPPLQRQFVASTRVFLNYRIEALGASGVGKVEVWYTRDMGQSWQKLCEDNHRQSPAEVNLPGEGVFGVSMVITNGRGFGGTPPSPGDTPDYWIEVDSTKPVADLVSIRPGSGDDSAALHIAWTARDKNLAADSIELQYASHREGPWHLVAKGLKSEGVYRWVPPVEVGAHAFLRLSVRDLSGNNTTTETTQPVALDDNSRPRGRVLGVTTAPPGRGGVFPSNQ